MGQAAVRLNWRGAKTVRAVASFLERQGKVALGLAPDLHHSLFVHLYPQAEAGQPEVVDIEGGAELLGQVAQIAGLEELAGLVAPLREADARIQVQSPAPMLIIELPVSGRFRYHP